VATHLYDEGMKAAGNKNASSNLQHNEVNITSVSQIQSSDFFTSKTNNITYYNNKNFNSPDIEVGSVAVWAAPEGAGWVGHVATIVAVERDTEGNVSSITTVEGHLGKTPTVDKNSSQVEWNSYQGTFLGFGEIGKNSTTATSRCND
jgi:hypothetical protein